MLLLRAFPLSFAIFWRFCFVLPLWLIFYVFLVLLSTSGFLSVASFGLVPALLVLPIFGLLAIAISFFISVHPYLLGIKIGLQRLGVAVDMSDMRTAKVAVGYGVVEAFLGYCLAVLVTAVALIAKGQIALLEFALSAETVHDPLSVLSGQLISARAGIVLLVIAGFALALRAAMLPVLAEAVAGRDPRGHDHSPMGGFAAGFGWMLAMLVVIIALTAGIAYGLGAPATLPEVVTRLSQQLGNVVSQLTGQDGLVVELSQISVFVLLMLLSIWLFALQCAGAVLGYEQRVENVGARKASIAAQQPDTPDIGDLLRSRMQKKKT